MARVAAMDDRAEAPAHLSGGADLEQILDGNAIEQELLKKRLANYAGGKPFRQYCKKVLELAEVRSTVESRRLASNVCSAIARLTDLPDAEEKIPGTEKTEWDLTVEKVAAWAEEQLGGHGVYTVAAMKLARQALALRKGDPDGKRGTAWVNPDPSTPKRAHGHAGEVERTFAELMDA